MGRFAPMLALFLFVHRACPCNAHPEVVSVPPQLPAGYHRQPLLSKLYEVSHGGKGRQVSLNLTMVLTGSSCLQPQRC